MGTTVNLPLNDYSLRDPRASGKQLIGCFPVPLDTDAVAGQSPDPDGKQSAALQRMHGIEPYIALSDAGPGDTNVRGFDEMGGVQYAVIGQYLYNLSNTVLNGGEVNPNDALNVNNPIPHIPGTSDFVRMTNNTECMVIIIPHSTLGWTYSPNNGGFQRITSTFFTTLGATDCWFVDTYIVFLAYNVPGEPGELEGASYTFFNDDGTAVSGNGPITFTSAAEFTREFGTDYFVGGVIDHREILLMGNKTSEGYVNVGASVGTPFQAAPDSFMHKGCHYQCAFTIAMQDEAPIWVANDLTVRRRNGQTPIKISTPGIDQFLQTANLAGSYALTPTVDGHPLWVLTCPNAYPTGGRSVAYDCLTQKWFDLESLVNSIGYWRPLAWTNWFGNQLVGDSQSPAIGVLSPNVFTEFLNSESVPPDNVLAQSQQLCQFTTQGVYNDNNRSTHRRLEVMITPGGTNLMRQSPNGAITNGFWAPTVEMFQSDNGYVFESFQEPVLLGAEGDYDKRAFWFNLGQARFRQYRFRVTDPTTLFAVDIQAELQGGKW